MDLKEELDRRVSDFVWPKFLEVRPETTVSETAALMKGSGYLEAIVVKGGAPVGIVTERDIIYKVVAEGKNPSSVRAESIMSSPIHTVDKDSKVGEAVAQMGRLEVRRLGVTDKGRLVGLITQKEVIHAGTSGKVPLPELASPKAFICPYCGAPLDSAEEVSKHIDMAHIGKGLLEGSASKW